MDYTSLWKDYQAMIAKGDVLVDKDHMADMPCTFKNPSYRSLAAAYPDRYAVCNDLAADDGFRLWRAARVYQAIRVHSEIKGRRLSIPELQRIFKGMPKTTAWRYLTNQIN